MPTATASDYRRRRLGVAAIAIVVIVAIGGVVVHAAGSSSDSAATGTTTTAAGAPTTSSTDAPTPAVLKVTDAGWRVSTPRSRMGAVTSDGLIVIAGGLEANSVSTKVVQALDPATGAIRAAGTLPEAVHDTAAVLLGTQVLVLGGGASSISDAVQGAEVGVTDIGTTSVGTLPVPRADLVAAVADGRVIVAGGYDGTTPVVAVLSTSDGVTFHTVAQLPTPVRYPAIAVVDHAVYLIGGETPGGDTTDIQRIDLAAGTAMVVGHLDRARSHASAAVLGGTVYVFGGRVGGQTSGEVLELDLRTFQTMAAGTMPIAASDMGVAVVGDTAYLIGGEDVHRRRIDNVTRAELVPGR